MWNHFSLTALLLRLQHFRQNGPIRITRMKNAILLQGHTEKETQFIARIEAYENILTVVHSQFPETKKIAPKLREVLDDKDWLSYNFKDFPTIAIYTKLTVMENDIKTQRKDIFTLVLSSE